MGSDPVFISPRLTMAYERRAKLRQFSVKHSVTFGHAEQLAVERHRLGRLRQADEIYQQALERDRRMRMRCICAG